MSGKPQYVKDPLGSGCPAEHWRSSCLRYNVCPHLYDELGQIACKFGCPAIENSASVHNFLLQNYPVRTAIAVAMIGSGSGIDGLSAECFCAYGQGTTAVLEMRTSK